MSDKKTQLYSSNANGSTYADPARPQFQVRFKTVKAPKNLDGLKTDNVITEIICTDKNTVTKDNATADDSISVRVKLSGSQLSHERLKEILTNMAAELPTFANENVIQGFAPVNPPSVY